MARRDNFRKWNEEMDAVLTSMYESGEYSAEELASKLGVTVQTVYPHMRLLRLPLTGEPGCKLRNYRSYGPRYNEVVFSGEQKALIVLRNAEGKRDTEIARELGASEGPVRKLRNQLGLPAHVLKPIPAGTRYGKLVVLKALSPRRKMGADAPNSLSSRSLCRCDCGKKRAVFNEDLRSGNTKTCGCRINSRNPDSEWIRVLHQVRHSAKSRRLKMGLSLAQVKYLGFLPCFYCGLTASNSTKPPKRGRAGRIALKYTGIDQVVPCGGYYPGNVLPSCFFCNRAKGNVPLEEFLPWVNLLHKRQLTTETVMDAAKALGEKLKGVVEA
jgi:hypothetical protein